MRKNLAFGRQQASLTIAARRKLSKIAEFRSDQSGFSIRNLGLKVAGWEGVSRKWRKSRG